MVEGLLQHGLDVAHGQPTHERRDHQRLPARPCASPPCRARGSRSAAFEASCAHGGSSSTVPESCAHLARLVAVAMRRPRPCVRSGAGRGTPSPRPRAPAAGSAAPPAVRSSPPDAAPSWPTLANALSISAQQRSLGATLAMPRTSISFDSSGQAEATPASLSTGLRDGTLRARSRLCLDGFARRRLPVTRTDTRPKLKP
jgi:hypothetical protein